MPNTSRIPSLPWLHYFSALAPVLCYFWTNPASASLLFTPFMAQGCRAAAKTWMESSARAFSGCCYFYTEDSMTPWGMFNWRQHLPKVTFCSVISRWQTCWQLVRIQERGTRKASLLVSLTQYKNFSSSAQARKLGCKLQNHRIISVRRGLRRSSSPTSC